MSRQNRIAQFFMGFCLAILTICTLQAETYYVAPSGSDSNNGSFNFPWQTLDQAIHVAGAGDTVMMRGGEYITNEVWIRGDRGMGGSNGQYLTIRNYPGEFVSIGGERRVIVAADFVRVEGLHFRLPYRISGGRDGGHVVNCTFEGPQPQYGAIEWNSDNGLIEGNTIIITDGGNTRDHAIYLHAGHNNIVRKNYLSGAAGYGIHGYDAVASGGDEAARGYRNILIEENIVVNCRMRSGIIIFPEEGLTTENVIIQKNIIAFNHHNGIRIRVNARDVKILNNTIFGNGREAGSPDDQSAISIRDAAVRDVIIRNNIIETMPASSFHVQNRENSSGIVVQRNLYWHGDMPKLANVFDDEAIYGDPLFLNPDSNHFRLSSGSPAIDAGLDVGLPFNGSAPDLGALEFSEPEMNLTPDILVTPASQEFGQVEMGATQSRQITVINVGDEILQVTGSGIFGTNAAEFTVAAGSAPFTLETSAAHHILVNFTPIDAGEKMATLRLTSNDPDESTVDMKLTGLAIAIVDDSTDTANSQFAPDSIFGNASNYEKRNPEHWEVTDDAGDSRFFLNTSNYADSEGRLGERATVNNIEFSDFVFQVDARSPEDFEQNPEADFALLFGFQDGRNYYYLMFNHTEIYNGLYLVEDGISSLVATLSMPVPVDNDYHRIVLSRTTGGNITASFDGLEVLNTPDNDAFASGKVGVGSFDDAVYFDNIVASIPIVSGIDHTDTRPEVFQLLPNYPNPFNAETTINYQLARAAEVVVKIFDLSGREVLTLTSGASPPGIYEVRWNGRNRFGEPVASGVYYCHFSAKPLGSNTAFREATRLLLLQ